MRNRLVVLALCALLTSCSGLSGSQGDDTSDPIEGSSDGEFVYNQDYIDQNLGDEYWITYSYQSKSNGVAADPLFITTAENEEGYYYKDNLGSETLYLLNGSAFDVYMPNDNGDLEKVPDIQLSKEEAEGYSTSFLSFMTIYEIAIGDLTADGSETVAGRLCDKYVFHAVSLAASIDIRYSIDKVTGVCLRYETEAVSGSDTGAFQFVCTVFKTDNVDMPSHI